MKQIAPILLVGGLLASSCASEASLPGQPTAESTTTSEIETQEDQDPCAELEIGIVGCSDEVRVLQVTLGSLNCEPGPDDGDYGDQTSSGVKRFQKTNELYEDGIAGAVTLGVIYSDEKEPCTTVEATTTIVTPEVTEEVVPEESETTTTIAPTTTQPPDAIAPENQQDNIPDCTADNLTDSCRQQAYGVLLAAGYADNDAVLRVRAYQAINTDSAGSPLQIDGVLGPNTFGSIDLDSGLFSETHSNDGRISDGAIVNLDTQIEYVYNDGDLVGAYAATTGIDDRWKEYTDPGTKERKLTDARTNTGNFTIQREVDGWKTSSDFQEEGDDPVMYETAYYDGGEANHGVPRGLMSNTATKLSAGCVRIDKANMDADANRVSIDKMIEIGDSFIIEGSRPDLPDKPNI